MWRVWVRKGECIGSWWGNRSWQPSCSHSTYQHEAITSRSRHLLMMGTWLPETCWATIRREIKNTKSDIQLVFLIHTELRCTVNHTKIKFWPSKWCIGNAGEMYVEGPCSESQIRYSGLTAGIPHLRNFRKLVPVSHLVKPRMFQIHFVQQ